METKYIKCQILFSRKKKENVINLTPADLVMRVIKATEASTFFKVFGMTQSGRDILKWQILVIQNRTSTPSTLGKIFCRQHNKIFFLIFPRKQVCQWRQVA